MSVRYWANNSYSTLAATMTAGATSLTINTPTDAFPATAPFVVIIGTELIEVGAVAGLTFSSLTRGYEGTTAAAHTAGAVVSHGLTAGDLARLQSATIAQTEVYGVAFNGSGDVALTGGGVIITKVY